MRSPQPTQGWGASHVSYSRVSVGGALEASGSAVVSILRLLVVNPQQIRDGPEEGGEMEVLTETRQNGGKDDASNEYSTVCVSVGRCPVLAHRGRADHPEIRTPTFE